MPQRCFHGFFIVLLLGTVTVTAQDPVFKTYSFREGLNTYGINKTIQDKYGFIWIATQDGIYRFNGKSFDVLKNNTGTANALAGNFFLDISLGKDEKVYAADFNRGIDIINTLNLSVAIEDPQNQKDLIGKLPNLWLKKIYQDDLNNLWIGGRDFLAYKRKNDTKYTVLTAIDGFNGSVDVTFIKPVSGNYLAIGIGGYGVMLFNMQTLRLENTIKKNDGLPGELKDIYMYKDTVWALTESAVAEGKFMNANWQLIKQYPQAAFKNLVVNCITRDQEDNCWIGTNSGLIKFNLASQNLVFYQANPGKSRWLLDNTINHLQIDDQDNLWISTSKVLQMISLRQSGFRSFSGDEPGSDHMDHIYSLVAKNKNEIFATGTGGLYITNITTGSTKKIPGSSALGLVHDIEEIEPDLWIVCTDLGMYGFIPSNSVISQKILLDKYPEWTPFRNNYFNNAFKNNDVSYWASEEQEGLIRWDKVAHLIRQFKAGTVNSGGLPENHIHNLKADREGTLWLMMDNTIAGFDIKKDTVISVIHYSKDKKGPNSTIYFDLFDAGETIWFGTYGGGLNGYNKKTNNWQYITEKDGLCNNSVYGILPEKDSICWVSTNMGLSRVNYFTRTCTNYFYEDGLQDNSFDEKGALQIDRKLYFGGINGFTQIDLDKFTQSSKPFPVYITRLEYYNDDEKFTIHNLNWNMITLPASTSPVTLYLSALSFANNHKIKFSYRIEGLQDSYIDVNDNNTITLNTLSYGTYKIDIRYRKEDGSLAEGTLHFEFYIRPKWYQTWWFKLLVLLTTAGIIYAFYRYRINQVKKQHEIRKSIATDLHDDLGSTLNSVKVFTNLAISGVNRNESLQQIKDNLSEATSGLRDMIWVLDDSLDTVAELVIRLKQFAIPVAAASNIETEISAETGINERLLTKDEKRNLFLICKEAVNNSIKYSGATQIDISIIPDGRKISITIADNGKGFDADQVKKGYGLKNMQYRAGQIKYTATVSSTPGKGTTVEIKPV